MARARVFLPSLLLAVAGCRSMAPPPSQFPSGADALARMKATFACQRGVHAQGGIDHFSERGRIRGKLLLFAGRPASLRFDFLGPPPFGSVVATLTTNGERFALSDQREAKFFEGPASACNIARLTEVSVPAHALVKLLGGEAPLLVHDPSQVRMSWSGKGYYLLTVPSTREATEEIRLVPTPSDFDKPWASQRVRVLDVRVVQKGVELYHAELGEHAWASTAAPFVDPDGIDPPVPPSGPPCATEVPRRLHIEAADGDQDMVVRYDHAELNPPLPQGVYLQSPPPGMQVVHVDCAE